MSKIQNLCRNFDARFVPLRVIREQPTKRLGISIKFLESIFPEKHEKKS